MKLDARFLPIANVLRGIVLIQILAAAPFTPAVTLWTGPNMAYEQPAYSPPSPPNPPPAADVLIPEAVSLTRAQTQWLYNTNFDLGGAGAGTPTKTLWAFGTLANYSNLTYKSFSTIRDEARGDLESDLTPNKPMVMRLQLTGNTNDDIYLSVMFTSWPRHGGPFDYIRSTPAAAPPTPTVSITNPPAGAVFASPANVTIAANATVSSGSVTNVAFFANGLPLGADQTAPFSITTGLLAADAYTLTAVATAAGVSTTSSVVSITVVSPISTSMSVPSVGNGQFSFDYTANPGLTYVVQNSSNLVDWLPVVTNVAPSNPVHFTHGFVPDGALYYRVSRLPNP